MKQMKAIDFVNDLIDEGFYNDWDSEDYWSNGGYGSSDERLEAALNEAKIRSIELIDIEELENEYDSLFYNAYKCNDDKGLS